MSAALSSHSLNAQLANAFPGVDVRALRDILSGFFWRWYVEHSGDSILKRKVLVFSVTIKVRDLRPLFVALFGTQPQMIGERLP